jgi:hypothetical protein
MASAGRILIMPKGAYDPNATYEMLDMVSYNGTSWLAKKTVKGIPPADAYGEYWHSLLDFDPSKKANGGVFTFSVNPNGDSHIIRTFNIEHNDDIVFYANTLGNAYIYITGIMVTNYLDNAVELKFILNEGFDGDLLISVGYIKEH